ncbi:glycogen/starch synthase [Nanoarchaeota archaeon]
MAEQKPDYIFEASWEVCNKVGGIYTVVKSKAALVNEQADNYYLVGPYFEEKAREEIVEEQPCEELCAIFKELEKEGIKCYHGKWLIKGEPKVILIDFQNLKGRANEFKKFMWDNYGIDSLNSSWDFEEPMIWSYCVARIVQMFMKEKKNDSNNKMVLHGHEWLAGFSILFAKNWGVNIGTVFTTHATMLGRSIAGCGRDLYGIIESINPEQEAYSLGVQDKFLTERACANTAEVFTTVSEITGMEAEKLLGRKPDVLLLNGLDAERFPTFEECAIKHRENRDVIREFVEYYFFPHYTFDLKETLFYFIVGRYEYKNKGLDIFIKALANLNNRLKAEKNKKNIVVFLWIPRDHHGAKGELSINKSNYYQMKEFIQRYNVALKSRIMIDLLNAEAKAFNDPEQFSLTGLFDKDFLMEAKKQRINFAKKGNPLLVTHELSFEQDDAIIKGLVETGLDNKEDDKVKVIFYPVYLTGVDGLIDLPYYDAIMGCHFGVFPSYYEPWGYTPLESAALGVPSLTTDLGGYGRFMMAKGETNNGVFVLKRMAVTEEETVNHFTEILYNFTNLTEKQRVQQKIKAKELSALADWNEFIKNYFNAYSIAISKL